MRTLPWLVLASLAAALAVPDNAQAQTPATSSAAAAGETWVQRSDRNSRVVLDVIARFQPESAASIGLDGLDTQISDLSAAARLARNQALLQAAAELERRRKLERDPAVLQDLAIVIDDTRATVRNSNRSEALTLPYIAAARSIYAGLRPLLDDQVSPERRQAALIRLRRYAGMEQGYRPLATVAEERTRERLKRKGLKPPFRSEVEQSLTQSALMLDGLAQLFDKYQIAGYQDALATVKTQVSRYDAFIRAELLPRSTDDFRLPPAVYAASLEAYGVDLPAPQVAALARKAFAALQTEMQSVAARYAAQRGWAFTDYRQVLREMKKEQIAGEAILPHYRARLAEIESIVRREKLVTLPTRDARIRIASAAESAAQPAPSMRPPRLINNHGEMGEFVLPLNIPSANGAAQLQYDDFTYAAASWSIAAHELRPGHEMQFAKMVERGISNARAIFAGNSTNVEGWGLYSEYILLPFMPLEGQLASLDFRLLRAARAFLDPELQMGKLSIGEAKRILMDDVICSEAMAKQETDRYTFRSPGQATSYFYGYTRLVELRQEVERRLGPKFNAQDFHDYVLDQGLLPPKLLRQAVLAHFVK